MKSKENELDVDYIGSEVPLTAVEEKAISDYIRQKKHLKLKSLSDNRKTKRKQKVKN